MLRPARTLISSEMLEQPPEALLPALMRRLLGLGEDEQFVNSLRSVLPEALHDAKKATLVPSPFRPLLRFLGRYLTIQRARGRIRLESSPELVAQTLISSVMGLILCRSLFRDSSGQSSARLEIAQTVSDMLLLGLIPFPCARVKSALSTFARWLIEEKGLLQKNPTRGIDLPAIQVLAPRQLSDDQRFILRSLVEQAVNFEIKLAGFC